MRVSSNECYGSNAAISAGRRKSAGYRGDPHRLIQMLMQGGLDRIAQARGAMLRQAYAEKGVLIGKAINIVGGLRDVLDKEVGVSWLRISNVFTNI